MRTPRRNFQNLKLNNNNNNDDDDVKKRFSFYDNIYFGTELFAYLTQRRSVPQCDAAGCATGSASGNGKGGSEKYKTTINAAK